MLAIQSKKTDHDIKVKEIDKKIPDHKHEKHITTPEFNKLTEENFVARLAQANFVRKTDFDNKLLSFNRKIVSNKTKDLLVQNQLKKLKAFHPIYFRGKSHFEDDGTQNWLVFQLIERYFKKIAGASNGRYVYYVYYWQSEGLSDETINSIKTSNHSISPNLDYYDTKRRVEFNGSCLKQDKIAFNYGKVVSIYIVYEINKSINISDYPTLENCLFGTFRLTKNADIDKYF